MKVLVGEHEGRFSISSDDAFFAQNASKYVADGYIMDMAKICETLDELQAMGYEVSVTQEAIALIKEVGNEDFELPSGVVDLNLYTFQKRGLNFAKGKKSVLFNWSTGTGKAQPLYSRVLTPDGFKTMGEIKVGDSVICGKDGSVAQVIAEHPQGVVDTYRVTFNDGSYTDCCGNHLWYAQTISDRNQKRYGKGGRYRLFKTSEMVGNVVSFEGGRKNYSIDYCPPIELNKKELLIDPYIMGIILGDGGIKYQTIITSADEELIEEISRRLPENDGIHRLGDSISYSITDYSNKRDSSGHCLKSETAKALQAYGLAGCGSKEKFIPDDYMCSSIEDRLWLLRGLLDSDGCTSRDCIEYSTVSEALRDGIVELVHSLGGYASWTSRMGSYKQNGVKKETQANYRVTIHFNKNAEKPFFLKRKADNFNPKRESFKRFVTSIEPIGKEECKCITISDESGLYITDDYIVTHNSVAGVTIVGQSIDDYDKIVIFCQRTLIREWQKRFKTFSNIDIGIVPLSLSAKKRKEFYENNEAKVWLINYEKMRTDDFDVFLKVLKGKKCVFMYDEMQKLRNRKSTLHKQFAKIVKKLDPIQYGFTATPVEKKPDDLYNIFRILEPTRFGKVADFERDFTYMDGAKDVWGAYIGYKNIGGMRSRVSDLIHTVDKNSPEIAKEFPEKVEIKIELDLNETDAKLYKKTEAKLREILKSGDLDPAEERAVMGFGNGILRGICMVPYTIKARLENSDFWVAEELLPIFEGVKPHTTSKIEATKQLVQEVVEQGEKIIIFCSQTHNALLPLAEELKEYNPLLYYGENVNERDDELEEFLSDPTKQVFLMSDAGREGLNLGVARYLLHFDTPFHYSYYIQRSERISRIDNKSDSVFVYRFVTLDTVEERIESTMMERKMMAAELGLGADFEDNAEVMSQDEAEYILFG